MNQQMLRTIIDGMVAAMVLIACIIGEVLILTRGLPSGVDQVLAGRILGTLDAAALIVLNYCFGSTRTSMQQVDSITSIGQAAANTPIHITLPDGTLVKSTTVSNEQAAAETPQVFAPQQSRM